jgi:PAS domain S-box-containing protein
MDAKHCASDRLAEVFQRSPSFTAVLSGPDHVFELANDRYLELVGHREVLGKPVREALPEVQGQGFLALLDQAYESGEPISMPETPIMLQHSPGAEVEVRHVEFVYQPLHDPEGKVYGVLVQGNDVTERLRAQAALREREERLRLLIDHASDYAMIMSDPDGRVIEWLGGAERITGWNEAEVLGRRADFFFTPEDRAAGVPEREMLGACQNGRAEDKRWHQRRDGSRFFGDGVMASLWDDDGELRGYGKVVRDVTERKLAEEAARRAERHKDDFIALLAHELRNPLAPIRNGLEVIRLSPGDRETVCQAQAMMQRQLGHMVRLIDDLLDVSRISRNKMELRRSQVTLQEVVTHAIETSRPLIEGARHRLEVRLPAEPVMMDADITRLAQVVSNLLTNSAKYTDPGGRIVLQGGREGDAVVISVSDDGVGIEPAMLPHVFEMFSQAGAALERSRGGLGIGLALVRGLVEMHGGSVHAFSEGPGQGSTFTVRLPASAPQGGGAEAMSFGALLPHARSGRMLVADDNADAAASLARVLAMLGCEVRTAGDGIEAVELARDFAPDVVLMDVAMPRMNGYEATRRIRDLPGGDRIVIVALTGWGLETDRERSREAGCDGHLVKPVGLLELEGLLDRLQAERERARG